MRDIYRATILGESPAWARAKRDCLQRKLAKQSTPPVEIKVTAVRSDVRVVVRSRVRGWPVWEEARRWVDTAGDRCGV